MYEATIFYLFQVGQTVIGQTVRRDCDCDLRLYKSAGLLLVKWIPWFRRDHAVRFAILRCHFLRSLFGELGC